MSRKKGERELFGIVVQPRYVRPERREVYDAVLRARQRGATVIRQGRDRHLVKFPWANKRVVTSEVLVQLFPPPYAHPFPADE